MRKATLSKLTIIIVTIQLVMALMSSVANASTVCEMTEYYNPSLGKVIVAEVCYDSSIADDEIDDSVEIDETIISTRDL